ncbi:PilN family type IVB pilus formation outer membrane protein [Photorhabdus khanii]|uniref:PilN family type IVB pilus formation outer membrane protein n=1 Tax=Photorhabdus khanii TaxID=1004150 RepID=A0A7C9KDU1_9GAMM|nr:PilN family type IVB pilus formation outer membrane protein [Photorhabdus khanii]
MKNKLYSLRLCTCLVPLAAVTGMALMSGCTLQAVDNMAREASMQSRVAQQHSLKQPVVTWVDKPWVNLKPVVQPVASVMLPSCQITINSKVGLTLPELVQRITQLCGIRVTVAPDVLSRVSTTAGGLTRQMNRALPTADDKGRMPLDWLDDRDIHSIHADERREPEVLTGLNWQGELTGLLDNIASRLGIAWKIDNRAVVFYRFETRTFQLNVLNTRTSSNASVASGSTSSMGTSGGSGNANNSVSGDASSSQKTTIDLNSDLYEDIRKTVENMLTPERGRFWLSSSSGTLMVSDTPAVLDSVSRYVEEQNTVLNRQVLLNVQVLSVSTTRKEQMGLDWGLVYNSLYNLGAMLSGSFGGMGSGATSAGVSILESATGKAAKLSGSSLLIKALSEQGNVSVVTSQGSATTNLTPIPIQMADQTVYVARSSTTTATDVGATTALTPGMITTGFNMTLLPLIQRNGDVQLQVAFNLSDPPTIRSFTSKEGNSYIEMPYTRLRSLSQKVNLRAGQALVLTGFEQADTRATKEGTFTPGNFLLGGVQSGENKRSTLVILITPVLLD